MFYVSKLKITFISCWPNNAVTKNCCHSEKYSKRRYFVKNKNKLSQGSIIE